MKLDIPDNLLSGVSISKEDVMLDLALGLFVDRRLSIGRAARLAGQSVSAFMRELGKRRIPIHYEEDDLTADIKTIAAFHEQRGDYKA